MSDKKSLDATFGLDMSMEEALQSFTRVTKEEIEAASDNLPLAVPEGEVEVVTFQKSSIRRSLHNGEWWYSVVDFVGAIAGTDRASKYWGDLKSKLTDKEGFFELSDKIGKLPMPSAWAREAEEAAAYDSLADELIAIIRREREVM